MNRRNLIGSCHTVTSHDCHKPTHSLSLTHQNKRNQKKMPADPQDDLIDYEDEDDQVILPAATAAAGAVVAGVAGGVGGDKDKDLKKGSYVGIHATGFKDFLLKPELLRAIVDCGFEHPSEGFLKVVVFLLR
jgi:hypothetical protein